MKKALTIAGTDSSGGAGVQADIKTMLANGVYAMSVITALTAQNTTGVQDIYEVSPEFLAEQLDSVFTDIYPDAVKTGMLSSPRGIEVIGEKLRFYGAKNIVVDPVMVATSGSRLIDEEAIKTLKEVLFPLASLITPNIFEGEILSGIKIEDKADMEKAAGKIYKEYGCPVLLKGGHRKEDSDDLLYSDEGAIWIKGERVDNPNTHGTGCTLSSAIASNLAKGMSLEDSVREAKEYLTGALKADLDLGHGSGPLDHGYRIH